MALAATMAVAIIISPLIKKYSLKSIRNSAVGGRGCAIKQRDTGCPLRALQSRCVKNDLIGAVSRVRPGMEVKLVDDAGNDINGYDITGKRYVRGSIGVPEYLTNP